MSETVGITLRVDGKTGTLTTVGKQVDTLGKQLDLTKQKAVAASGGFNTLTSSIGALVAGAAIFKFFKFRPEYIEFVGMG